MMLQGQREVCKKFCGPLCGSLHTFTNRASAAAGRSAAVGSPPPTTLLPTAPSAACCPRRTSVTLQLLNSASQSPKPEATCNIMSNGWDKVRS